MKLTLNTSFKNYKNTIINLMFICFAILVLVRDIGGFPINKYLFIIIATIVFAYGPCEKIFSFMAFMTPLHMGVPYTFITILAVIALIAKRRIFRISKLGILGIGIILALELVNGFRGNFVISEFVKFSGILLFCFLVVLNCKKLINGIEGAVNYIWGFAFAAIDLWGQMLNSYSLNEIITLRARFGNTRQILNIETEGIILSYNPNTLGAICVIASMLCIFLIKVNYNQHKICIKIIFLISTLMGVMTLSRTAILCLALGIVLMILLSSTDLLRGLRNIVIVATVLLLAYSVVKNLLPSYFVFLEERFNANDIFNGRTELLTQYFDIMFMHLDKTLFGVGIQNYREIYKISESSHNAIQEVMISWGVVGLVTVLTTFYVKIRDIVKGNNNFLIFQSIPFVIYFIILQATQGFSVRGNILILLVTFSVMTIDVSKINSCGEQDKIDG